MWRNVALFAIIVYAGAVLISFSLWSLVAVVGLIAVFLVLCAFPWKKNAVMPGQVADIIERFIQDQSRYPQEFHDFFECGLADPKLDAYRKRCEIMHAEFECPRGEDKKQRAQREAAAKQELVRMVVELRSV